MSPTRAQEIPDQRNNRSDYPELSNSRTVQISSGRSLKCFMNFFWRLLSWVWAAGWEVSESESSSAWEVGRVPDCPLPPEQAVPQTQTVKTSSVMPGLAWPPVIVLLLITLCFSSLPSSSEAATDMTEREVSWDLRHSQIRDRDILSVVCSVARQCRGALYIIKPLMLPLDDI